MERRDFNRLLAGMAMLGGAKSSNAAPAASEKRAMPGNGGPAFSIGMVVFDNMTNLDFAGPNQVFGFIRGARIHVVGKTMGPVTTDSGVRVLPSTTMRDAPDLDLLFVGGGGGSTLLMEDPEALDFFTSRAPRAQFVTAVCTGTLVLGAAGLLRGYRATTHWTCMHVLPTLGAQPVSDRVVFDRNRITGGGVTAGIDFGLAVLGHVFGDELGQRAELICEYDPKPPYGTGYPDKAPPELVTFSRNMWQKQTDARMDAAVRRAKTFG